MTKITRLLVTIALISPLTAIAGAAPEDLENAVETVPELGLAKSENAAQISSNSPITTDSIDSGDKHVPIIQFYASDKAAELLYETGKSTFGLNNDRSRIALLFNEERDNAITASILFDTDFDSVRGFRLSFGPKIIAGLLAIENTDVIGLGANIEADYTLPLERLPLRLSAELTYAPDILTFGQSDRIIDTSYRIGLPLTSNIDGFVGIRYLQFDTRPGERKLDQKVHVGFRWSKRD